MALVSLGALVFQLLFLAVILGVVGYHLNKGINAYLASRQEREMKAKALHLGTRARALRTR